MAVKTYFTPRTVTTLWWLAAIFLGAVFCYSGIEKIWGTGPKTFLNDIRSFHILPDPWAGLTAVFLPVLEIICGLALILGRKSQGAAAIIAAMLVVFILALAWAGSKGIDVRCGCFGQADGPSNIRAVILRDLLLLAFAIPLCFRPSGATEN